MPCFKTRARAFALVASFGAVANAGALEITPDAGPALAGPGDGLTARFVEVDGITFDPHSTADAIAILSQGAAHAGYVREISQNAPYIDYRDTNDGLQGFSPSTDIIDPLAAQGADHYAVSYKGFLNITAGGDYNFRFYGDDGFRLTLGGVQVSEYPNDTSPLETQSGPVTLHEGLYSFTLVSWEQGGLFVNELSWRTPGSADFTLPGSGNEKVFFTSAPSAVPVPAALPLLLSGLVCLRRRKR